jgi:hypothetical protein
VSGDRGLTPIQKAAALISGTLSGVIGAIGLGALLLSVTSSISGAGGASRLFGIEAGHGLSALEMAALIVGLSLGFAAGVGVWSLVATRAGWLSWEDVAALMGRRGSEDGADRD